MEPVSTLAEIARILRPGGVFASFEADWPPVAGLVRTNGRHTQDSLNAWPRAEHLANMVASNYFAWCREVFFHQTEAGGADRFIALLQSQGGYQSIGSDIFEREVRAAYADSTVDHRITFSWRARLGVKP